MNYLEIKSLLNEKYHRYNSRTFIETDPVCIPHRFSQKENIEISGFLTATIAWGQRGTIIRNSGKLIQLMENNPYEFIMNTVEKDWSRLNGFCHRTFSEVDLKYFLKALAFFYRELGGLERFFTEAYQRTGSIEGALKDFHKVFFSLEHPQRSRKHIADIGKGASAKRLNMFLRWMVRRDRNGVDFGIWNKISPAQLYIPLDTHSGNVARALGLLIRKQNDWKAVIELTRNLQQFDKDDPVKYDFALFGMGVFENLK